MKAKPVIQYSLTGEFIKRFPSITSACESLNVDKKCIRGCCNGIYLQSCNSIWLFEEDSYLLPKRLQSIYKPIIPKEWGTEWRDVKGFEGAYKVSDKGIIIALHKITNGRKLRMITPFRKLKTFINFNGYYTVKFCMNSISETRPVHRVIAEAFIPNPQNLPIINHKDENKLNNAIENLEWCTIGYNTSYGTAPLRRKLKVINGKCSKQICQYDLQSNFLKEYPSIAEIHRLGFKSTGLIIQCCKGLRESYKGFKWKYKSDIS